MAMSKQHRILIATDGSRPARAALATAAKFPWPASSRVRTIIARSSWLPADSAQARAAVEKSFQDAANAARRALARRWPESKVVRNRPASGLVSEHEPHDDEKES